MPKIVDHDARRSEIVRAMWRVVSRDGIEAASVRTIAHESGWSAGAVRHYFATQNDLLVFAVEAMMGAVRERVRGVLLGEGSDQRRVARALEQLLPLDEERLAEARVWLALKLSSRGDPRRDELLAEAWHSERHLCRIVVQEMHGLRWPEPGEALPRRREALAERLHLEVDGLTLQAATVPELLPASAVRSVLQDHLAELRAASRT